MGSLDEDELAMMVQDFIESESIPNSTTSNSSKCHDFNHRTQFFILQDILRSEGDKEAEGKVLKHVLKHMRSKQGSEKTSTSLNRRNRWLAMRLKKDGINASLCQTSWSTSLGCPAGEYEYVEVVSEGDNYVRLIVDIDFRSQFEVARPTQSYRELTESLPVMFVGSEKKLCKIISLLCSAAKQCLREKGLHVPPWRTTTYMQSKWLSNHKEPESHNERKEEVYTEGGSVWVPPTVRPKKRELGGGGGGGGSGLSSQFSGISINCCYV